VGTLIQDIRFGLRMLAKNPGFTAVAVLTLALGIGGTTAIFSIFYGAVLNPFPYPDSHRLAVLVSHDKRQGDSFAWVSGPEFLDYQKQNRVFDEVICTSWISVVLTGTTVPVRLDGWGVTDNVFRVLGASPLFGRPLTPEDDKPGAPPVVVLSYKGWRSKFRGDPGIVGRTLILNHIPTTVIGVMPPRFAWGGVDYSGVPRGDCLLPAGLSRRRATDGVQYCTLIGPLKAGVSIEQAAADVAVLSKRFAKVYPRDHPKDMTFGVESLVRMATGQLRKTLYILLGAVGLLLLIACVNVANLLVARATGREREFAIRASLGASRGRLVRQLTIESLLLAIGGAVLGCLVTWNLLGALVAIFPPLNIPPEAVIRINGPVLLFTLGATLLSTMLFGLAPALLAVGKDLQAPLKASGRGVGESRGHHRLRNLLVVSEVALSLLLLTGAGLLIRSFIALQRVDPGFNLDHVLVAVIVLPEDRYKTVEQKNQYHMELLRRVRTLPGVASAALGVPPPTYTSDFTAVEIAGKPSAEGRRALLYYSSDRFFETMRIRLLQGRTISEEDLVQTRKVAVINRTFASKYFGADDPLGRQIKLPDFETEPFSIRQPWFEVVGVVTDIRHSDPQVPPQPEIYLPHTFAVAGGWKLGLFVRTMSEPAVLSKSVGLEAAAIDKDLPVEFDSPLRDRLKDFWFAEPRFLLTMLVVFASLGLVLVSIGVYSVLSYAVSRRTHEIGIRMALGAQATDVRRMVMMSGLRWLAVGIGIGIPASIALAKILQNRIWGIKSADPLTLIVVSLVLMAVGLAACYFPARRATKVDPIVALRYE